MQMDTVAGESKLEKLAEKAAAKAFRKSRMKEEVDIPDDFGPDDINNLLAEPVQSDSFMEQVGFDVFDFCDKLQKTQGHQISYVIKRNGEMLTVKYHPYAWETLQKEFGAGQYQIIAKSITTKKYLKMETRVLADYKGNIEQGEKETKSSGMEFDKLILLMQQQREADRMEMKEQLEKQKHEEERRRIEEKERAKETISQTQNQTIMMLEMMKMMNEKAERSTIELAKLQQAAEERASKAQEKQMQLMMTLMQSQMQNAQGSKDQGVSAFELMKLTKEAEEAGFNKYLQMMNLARAEAEERMAYMGEGGDKSEKKSITDTLIETMLPTITSALSQKALSKVPQARGAIPTQTRNKPLSSQTQAFGTKEIAAKSTGQKEQTNERGPVVAKSSLGLPTIKFMNKPSSSAVELPTSEQIEEWLTPVITEALLTSTPASETTPKVVEVIKNHGLSKENFCKIMTEDKLLGLVSKHGLPEIALDWFKELHADIQTTA